MTLQKINSQMFKLIRTFFLHTNHIPLFHKLGILLYKLGGWLVLQKLKKIPTIESIYLKTKFDDYFKVGESDIDFHVVVKDVEIDKEIEYLGSIEQTTDKITKTFPFINHVLLYTRKNFEGVMNSTPLGYRDPLSLIYGKKLNLKHNYNLIDYMTAITQHYLCLLFIISESTLNKEDSLRQSYKLFYKINRILYALETKKYTTNKNKLKLFLKNKNIPEDFANKLYNLPKIDYKSGRDFLAPILFYTMKLIETTYKDNKDKHKKLEDPIIHKKIKEKDKKAEKGVLDFSNKINKKHVESIYYFPTTRAEIIPNLLIITIPSSLNYPDFKKQFDSISKNLHLIKSLKEVSNLKTNQLVALRGKANFTLPVIITKKIMLMPGIRHDSKINLNHYYKKMFGETIKELDYYEEYKEYYKLTQNLTTLPFLISLIKNLIPEDREIFFRHIKQGRLLIEKNLFTSGLTANKEYEKHFGKINVDLNNYKDFYKNYRKVMRTFSH